MSRTLRGIAVTLAASLALCSFAQLTRAERSLVDDALFCRGWRLADLDSVRRSSKDASFSPALAAALDHPLAATDRLLDFHQASAGAGTTELLLRAMRLGYPNHEVGVALIPGRVDVPALKGGLRSAVGGLVAAMASCNEEVASALANLSAPERLGLQGLLLRRGTDTDLRVRPPDVVKSRLLLARVDLPRIRAAGVALASAVEDAVEQLKQTREDVAGITLANTGGIRVMVLPRKGETVDVQDVDLVVALGGHNTIAGKVASGVQKSGVLIDLGDDSSYTTRDPGMGCGLLGVGLAYFGAGRTSVLAGDAAVGAGIAGVGFARFEGGEVRVSSGSMSQGFGYEGVGICLDSRSDTAWRSVSWSQGAARSGGVGWMVDRGGSDFFEASGTRTSSRSRKRSSSQGYSSGSGVDLAEDPGGIGLLSDFGGDDTYRAESDAQGSADWRGVGSLFDVAGNDRYLAAQFAVATAAHQSFASFFDGGGDDLSVLSGGVGLGSAYADSVSVWLDRDGSDRLVGGELPPGSASTDSLCLQVKALGQLVVATSVGFAHRSGALDALNLTAPPRSGNPVTRVDLERSLFVQGPRLDLPERPLVRADDPRADLDTAFEQACTGDQAALALLVAAGRRALDHAVRARLGKADGLERQLVAYLVQKAGDAAASAFAPVAVSNDETQIRGALLVGARARGTDLLGTIPRLLKEHPALALDAAAMAGALHANSAVLPLLPLLADRDPRVVRVTLMALGQIGDDSCAGSAQVLLLHPDPVVREEAARLLALFPRQAAVAADSLLAMGDEAAARAAVHLLGLVGTPEALTTAAGLLKDSRAGVRYSVLLELDSRFPPGFKRDLPSLASDPDARVRALAKRVMGG